MVQTVAHVTYAFMDKAAEPLFISGGGNCFAQFLCFPA
jgi:hypothetical protein